MVTVTGLPPPVWEGAPVLPHSSWARASRTLLAAGLPRAKGSGRPARGASLSPSAEAGRLPRGSAEGNGPRAERPYCTREGQAPREAPVLQLGVSTSRVRRWTCRGRGVGAGAGTQTSSPCPRLGPRAASVPRGPVLAQAARLSPGGRVLPRRVTGDSGGPALPHASRSAGKAGVSHPQGGALRSARLRGCGVRDRRPPAPT